MPTIGAQTASASSAAVKRSSEWLDDEPIPSSPHTASHSTSSPVKRARTALKNTAAQSKKLADQARDKSRQAFDKTLTAMENRGMFPKDSHGKIWGTADVMKRLDKARDDIDRLNTTIDTRFEEMHAEMQAVSQNLQDTKNSLYEKLIISNINVAMTQSTREEFMTNFKLFQDFFEEYKASIEYLNQNVDKLHEDVEKIKEEHEGPTVSQKFANAYLKFTRSSMSPPPA